jgi:hypothetical protein
MTDSYLTGKFVLYNLSSNSYRTGVVVAASGDNVLVQFDIMGPGDVPAGVRYPMELIGIDRITNEVVDDHAAWGFFDSREQLDAFLKWVEGDGQPRGTVVRLMPDKPKDR